MTRVDSTSGDWYDVSAHLLWIGERTRQLDGAHVEFMRGVNNPHRPQGRPDLEPDELIWCPDRRAQSAKDEPGRLTLYGRFGSDKIAAAPAGSDARHGERGPRTSAWAIDPMHGNTLKSRNTGYKTRPFDRILSEVKSFIEIAQAEGVHPRRRSSGDDRPERHRMPGRGAGGGRGDLADRYHTHCDPRLNGEQALELAFLVAES